MNFKNLSGSLSNSNSSNFYPSLFSLVKPTHQSLRDSTLKQFTKLINNTDSFDAAFNCATSNTKNSNLSINQKDSLNSSPNEGTPIGGDLISVMKAGLSKFMVGNREFEFV